MKEKPWKIEIRIWNGETYVEKSTLEQETLTFYEMNFRADRVSVFPHLREVTLWVTDQAVVDQPAVRP